MSTATLKTEEPKGPVLDYEQTRAAIKVAFRKLRIKHMLEARMNIRMCCDSCAANDLGAYLEANPEKTGYVFWSTQNDESFIKDGRVYINFAHRDITDEETQKVGVKVAAALRAAGAHVTWDGSPDQSVKVSATGGKPHQRW